MGTLPIPHRVTFAAAIDVLALLASWAAALLLVQGGAMAESAMTLWAAIGLAATLHVLSSIALGVYRGAWRQTTFADVCRLAGATALGAGATAFALTVVASTAPVTWRELVLYPLLFLGLMSWARLGVRALSEWRASSAERPGAAPVLLLGAGDVGGLLSDLAASPEWRVVGILDDDATHEGEMLQGVTIRGRLEELPAVANRLRVHHAIITLPAAAVDARRRVIDLCKRARVTPLVAPPQDSGSAGRVAGPRVRRVSVEDLMRRDAVVLDDAGLHDLLTGKVVMVTGAGGSIGSELCRQIAAYQPSMLVLFEQNEFAMYRVDAELREEFPELPVASVVGDVKSPLRVEQVMRHYSPSIVFHAAAYKHVPLMEEVNAWEAIQNNVYGTHVLARAAIDSGVRKFVFVSTDKAVNPTNVMGASKRLAEMVCQGLQSGTATRFEMVRFGNVLGSAGSVIPRFQEQIDRGGPVTVTHPEMVRYFMSIPEAAQLVLQAGSMGLGGEIFVMDMGEPVKIVDLARDMIRLSDRPEGEIRIVYSGLRPGEKLFEELLADDEHTRPTPHPKLRIAKAREADGGAWLEELVKWLTQAKVLSDVEVRRDLKRWVPEFQAQVKPKLKQVGGTKAA